MRLFIAIPLSKELNGYCRNLQSGFSGMRKTRDFHLTLQFLGEGIKSPEKIIEALEKIRFDSFEVQLGDIMPFGPKNAPRGIWIECKENKDLKALSQKVRAAMGKLGLKADKPFRAHITLGRYREVPREFPKILKGSEKSFLVNHYELIQSHLSDAGSEYETLKEFFANKEA